MKLLIDNNPVRIGELKARYSFIGGQLLTPLTRNSDAGGAYGIDNGAYSRFDAKSWRALVRRQLSSRERCQFLAMPDVVGNARRTLEIFHQMAGDWVNWPLALVAQDGLEELGIPWDRIAAIFVGGTTEWKMSQVVTDILKAAAILGKHTHVGRVNTPARWLWFRDRNVDTCDGSGVSRYDHMLDAIQEVETHGESRPLFTDSGSGGNPCSADRGGVCERDTSTGRARGGAAEAVGSSGGSSPGDARGSE